MLLEFYWLILYWWRTHACLKPNKYDFSTLGFCWWLLSIYFTAVLTFLLSEVIRRSDIIFGGGTTSGSSNGDRNVEVVLIKAAFISMLLYLHFCIAVFLVMKLEGVVSRSWNWKRHDSVLTV